MKWNLIIEYITKLESNVIISALMHTTWFRLLFFNGFGRRGLYYISLELTSLLDDWNWLVDSFFFSTATGYWIVDLMTILFWVCLFSTRLQYASVLSSPWIRGRVSSALFRLEGDSFLIVFCSNKRSTSTFHVWFAVVLATVYICPFLWKLHLPLLLF